MSSGVRFLHSRVGAQIAYRTQGTGPPLIIIPPWINHLDAITAMSGYRQFNDAVAAQHTVVHYDRGGTGLSDRDRHDFSLKGEVQVLTDVADHLGLRRFALMGPSRGGPVAVAFAHGEARRVSHLILYGTGGRRCGTSCWPTGRRRPRRSPPWRHPGATGGTWRPSRR